MSKTLTYKETIQRTGYTIIEGEKVVQYTLILDPTKPEDMRIGITKLNPDLYKANRDICRADYAKFEDDAYLLQESYMIESEESTDAE